MATHYCSASDLYDHGLPRGGVPNPGRLAGSVSTSTSAFELDGHGLDSGDQVSFRADAGGSLPSPLVTGQTYYALPVDDAHFRVESSVGAGAVTLNTTGARVLVVIPLPILGTIEWASRVIDDMLPAHVSPLSEPIPQIVRVTCAEIAAKKLAGARGADSLTLNAIVDAAHKRLERWAKGIPLRGPDVPARAGLAGGVTADFGDRMGWRRYGGIR